MVRTSVTRLVAAVAVVMGLGQMGPMAAAQEAGPAEAMSVHSAGLDKMLGAEKDAALLSALRLVDERLRELPAELPDADPAAWPVLALAWDVLTRPMTMRFTVDAESDQGPPFALALDVHAEDEERAGELAGRMSSMIEPIVKFVKKK